MYVKETWCQDGKPFPFRTIDLLLSALEHYINKLDLQAVDIFSEKDLRFAGLRGMRDTLSRELCEAGVSTTVKHTSVTLHYLYSSYSIKLVS